MPQQKQKPRNTMWGIDNLIFYVLYFLRRTTLIQSLLIFYLLGLVFLEI